MENMTDPKHDGLWTQETRPKTYAWEFGWAGLIQELGKLPYPPKYVVLNAGLWPHDLGKENTRNKIVAALRENDMIGIYKTTTVLETETNLTEHLKTHTHEHAMCEAVDGCMNLTYTVHMSLPDEYWDGKHLQPTINRRFNEELFTLIEDLEQQRRSQPQQTSRRR